MTREKVAAHYAISSLFESYAEDARIYSFAVRQEDRQLFTAGNARLAIGRIKVSFTVTKASDVLTYGVLYMGEHHLNCGVRYDGDLPGYAKAVEEMRGAFERADFPELIRVMDKHFGQANYSLKNLFRDEQFKVLNQILAATRDEIHNTYRLLTDRYAPLTRFLNDIHVPPLNSLAPATEFVLNAELRKQFENGHLDAERVKSLLAEARTTKATLESKTLAFAIKKHFDRLSDELSKSPEDLDVLERLKNSAALLPLIPAEVNLWKSQNVYDQLQTGILPEIKNRADEKSKAWTEKFRALGEQLGFHVEKN
jgi:hypothetical protein